LDRVSLTLNDGDIYGLVGRNGAGKTTFFKCVLGLATPTSGAIEIGGTSDLAAARKRMGFFINSSFFAYLNPYQNLQYLCRVKGIKPRGEVERLLQLVGLDGVRKPFSAFSMGMKQRLGIAAAMLGSPPVVVLDEPVNGLDPQGIMDIRTVIKDAHAQFGTTFIVSSHILSELDLVATRFGFIEQGVLLKEISHDDLHEHTKQTLVLEVDDVPRALAGLRILGVDDAAVDGNKLVLKSGFDRSADIARALVAGGVALFDMHRQETTLEEYFFKLIGGGADA